MISWYNSSTKIDWTGLPNAFFPMKIINFQKIESAHGPFQLDILFLTNFYLSVDSSPNDSMISRSWEVH